VTGWVAPAAAASFWAGLLSWPIVRGRVSPWLMLLAGVALLVAGAVAAPRRERRAGGGLRRLGLVPAELDTTAAVDPGRLSAGRGIGLPIAFVLPGLLVLALGWGGLQQLRVAHSLTARLSPAHVEAIGSLRTDPSPNARGWSAEVDLTSISWSTGEATLRESVWVSGHDSPPNAVRGDLVSISGSLRRPDDPGFEEALWRKGIAAELSLDDFERIGGSSNAFVRATQVFRAFVGRSIQRLFPSKESGLLMGLALGDDSRLDPSLARDFQATGLGHLLVVSGENVAMVLGPMLGLALALRLTRWPRFLLGLGTVVFFVVLTGAEPSVMRAGVMAALTLLGVLLGRPKSAASILSAAVLFLLVLDPWLVWSIGFQLSVAATAGMVALASPIADRMAWIPKPIALAAGTTLAAQLAVTPVLLFHFHEVPGVTAIANLAAFPSVSPALLLGLLAAMLGLLWLPLGKAVAAIALLPMRYLELVADRLAKAPVGWITSGGGAGVLLIGGGLVVVFAWWLRVGRRISRRAFVAAAFVLPLFVWSTALSAGPPAGLTIHFFDIGQGDAALIQTPEGANVLIDGGPDPEVVATDLVALGVKRLDLVVATHQHADHIVGLPNVLARFPVSLFLENGCPDDTPFQDDLDTSISDEHIPVRYPRTGDTYRVGTLRLDVLSPDRCWNGTNSDPNNDSIVLLLTYREDTVLMTGDTEREAQQVMLDEDLPLHVEVLKVPHHGGDTSLPEYLTAIDPELSVISVGQPNPYGHPTPELLEELAATGTDVWRTDQHGDVTVTFGPEGIVVASDR